VHGRTSKLALAAGTVVVLGMGIGLERMTRSEPPSQKSSPAGDSGVATPAEVAGAVAPAGQPETREAREDRAMSSGSRRVAAAPVMQPGLAPAVGFGSPELKRDENGHLVPIIDVSDLREQFERTDAAMKECVGRSGQHATGKATLGFTVAAKNNKLVIESTGIFDDETLAGYPEMLDCMHRTANLLVLDGHPIPELGTAIYVRRHVRVENGALAENTIFNFSYNP
jgi:hypothetical protein